MLDLQAFCLLYQTHGAIMGIQIYHLKSRLTPSAPAVVFISLLCSTSYITPPQYLSPTFFETNLSSSQKKHGTDEVTAVISNQTRQWTPLQLHPILVDACSDCPTLMACRRQFLRVINSHVDISMRYGPDKTSFVKCCLSGRQRA